MTKTTDIKGVIISLILISLCSLHLSVSAKETKRVLKDEFFEVAEDYIRSHAPWNENEIKLKRKYVHEMEIGDIDFKLSVGEVNYSKPWGTLLIPVEVRVQDKRWKKVHVYLQVTMKAPVAIAIKNIRHHEPLTDKNVKFITMPLSAVPYHTIIKKELITNTRAIGALLAGSVVTRNSIETIPAIKAGDRVRLDVNHNGLVLSASGTAKEDGYIGKRVRVLNNSSHKILVGIVKENGIVEIHN